MFQAWCWERRRPRLPASEKTKIDDLRAHKPVDSCAVSLIKIIASARICCMSKADILEELPKLTPAERNEIRLKLAELDGHRWLVEDDPLSEEEKLLVQVRMESHERNPDSAIPWDEFKARLNRRLGQ
jgi:putative addiction module component (TIGR02574 family)